MELTKTQLPLGSFQPDIETELDSESTTANRAPHLADFFNSAPIGQASPPFETAMTSVPDLDSCLHHHGIAAPL